MTVTNITSSNLGSLFTGEIAGQTIFGHGGTQTIYGDAYLLTGRVTAHANVIWAEAGYGDGTAVSDIYGNAYIMSGNTTAGNIDYAGQRVGNAICDSHGALSHLYGNAYLMTDHASGGYTTIYARSATSWAYGDAYSINGTGVSGGHNAITFESAHGAAYGDAYSIQGTFSGGHNSIWIGNQADATVYGTAYTLGVGNITCGGNHFYAGSGSDTIYGDAYENYGNAVGGGNVIYAGSGFDMIYGSCGTNYGAFVSDGNTISAGLGNATIFGSCVSNQGTFTQTSGNTIYGDLGSGRLTIYGNCASNTGTFNGGHNTIYASAGTDTIYGDCGSTYGGTFHGGYNTIHAGTGNVTMYGSATDGHNTFVFGPGAGVDQIGSRSGAGVIQGFDQEGGTTFDHAKGDVIDLSAYHVTGVAVTQNINGDAVIQVPVPSTGAHWPQHDQITLVGVSVTQLTSSDFRF
jgi:hypothetical protein